ncbi:Oidioi.mRNA.OKI2018_I69.PAR.g9348.t1.cds [Oikopleura dioica]|uniref:Oidioi.mRNA.OKI2018_I69.PAR.g9343.t1.cds n=1 Tax=Oikopleura dioica TaxID=34765 RepID=A0ABN7RMV1_OIKDI|nr:Oidioi.mRNA.OKI2018_I69.PAR.g9343.t1.cds [Oikopleura dioica]CAG5079742.1 Oidioi.mRNA.OKI2018_I69.PAR.g9348.t1.cds [Oikopleura dioica]
MKIPIFAPIFLKDSILAQLCPDQDLGDLCESNCKEDLLSCLENCSTAACQEECYLTDVLCETKCPCNIYCPNGCEGCEHPLCNQPSCFEENELEYANCVESVKDKLSTCYDDCTNELEIDCYSACNDESLANIEKCPCMSGCDTGCPCENYTCSGTSRRLTHLGVSWQYPNYPPVFYMTDNMGLSMDTVEYEFVDKYTNSLIYADFAFLRGVLYIFGGDDYEYSVQKMNDDCTIEKVDIRPKYGHRSIAGIETFDDKIWLCFYEYKKCQYFDGETFEIADGRTADDHNYGSLCTGAWLKPAGTDHPVGHAKGECLTLEDGVLTMAGEEGKEIYLLRDLKWSNVGRLLTAVTVPTLVRLDDELILFAGSFTQDVQKMIWNGETIEDVEIIFEQPEEKIFTPIVFESFSNKCKA